MGPNADQPLGLASDAIARGGAGFAPERFGEDEWIGIAKGCRHFGHPISAGFEQVTGLLNPALRLKPPGGETKVTAELGAKVGETHAGQPGHHSERKGFAGLKFQSPFDSQQRSGSAGRISGTALETNEPVFSQVAKQSGVGLGFEGILFMHGLKEAFGAPRVGGSERVPGSDTMGS